MDTEFIGVFPALKAVDNGDGTYSVAASIPGMPPLTGMTSGELLVATSATTAAWQSTGVKLSAPDISGVVTAAAALTMPTFKLGGILTTDSKDIQGGTVGSFLNLWGSTTAGGSGGKLSVRGSDTANAIVINTPNAAKNADVLRLIIQGNGAEISAQWTAINQTGLKLGGALTLNGQVFDAGAGYLEVNTTGNRGLELVSTDAQNAARIRMFHNHTTPEINFAVTVLDGIGYDSAGTPAVFRWSSIQTTYKNITDGAEASELRILLANAGVADNVAMTLSGAGALTLTAGLTIGGALTGLTTLSAFTTDGALTLGENAPITLDAALSADGKYSGTVEAGTAGAILAFGDLVYLAVADSKWELTDADAEATAFGKIGICVAAAAEDAATVILLWGKVRADAAFPTLTVGAPVYVGLTPGDIVTTAPSATADIVRIIGYGNTADELFFCPENTYIEIA